MSDKPFKVYKSSAGSGKTYTLVKEYLRLALARPGYYRHILAVTFTNKATREMKTRVIQSLRNFSRGVEDPMASELKEALKLNQASFQQKSQQVLSNILHGYAHFAVSTIDTFFQKIIRSFAKEVGLYGGFKLELEEGLILDEVIDRLIDDIEQGSQLTEWLVSFAQEKVDAGKSWDIRRDLRGLGKELFGETLKREASKLHTLSGDKSHYTTFQKQIDKIVGHFESGISTIGHQALTAIADAGLQITDFSYGKAGVVGYFVKICKRESFEPGKRAINALDNTEAWYSASSPHRDAIESLAENLLIPLLNQAVNYYTTHFLTYQSAIEVRRQWHSFEILSDIASKLQDYKSDQGIMLISDAGEFLHQIIKDNDTPFIYEKTGSFYNHYLIDEFQDTSGFQWENFRPLIKNGLAEGKMSMVVGDAKQSIYRWRGGNPMILQAGVSSQIGEGYTGEVSLTTNFRSATKIIDFNNTVFRHLPEGVDRLLTDKVPDEPMGSWLADKLKLIREVYCDVSQLMPSDMESSDYQGFVKFSFVASDKTTGVDWKEHVLEELPIWLEKLQDQGVAIEEIAILVRKASDAQLVMDTMMQYQHEGKAKAGYSYTMTSNESLQIGHATVVQMMLNIFRYLRNPRDQVARANMVYAYQYKILKKTKEELHELLNTQEVEKYLPQIFINQQDELKKKPLYELTEVLLRVFELHRFTGETAYLQAFQDVVLKYTSDKSNDLYTFLEWWEENGYKQKVKLPAKIKAVQVLTIHKSKGLQFKAVLLPFVHWTVDHEPGQTNIIWTKSEETPYDLFPILPLRYGKSLSNTVFAKAYYQEKISTYLDSINLLYVAFTRAEEYLIGYGPIPGRSISRVSDLLFEIFGTVDAFAPLWEEESGTFTCGQLRSEAPIKPVTSAHVDMNYVSHDWTSRLKVKYRAGNFFGYNADKMKGVDFGNLLHELMARVITPDQVSTAVAAMYYEGMIAADQRYKLEEEAQRIVTDPTVSTWFDSKWTVKTEVPILPASGELHRLDRVMISGTTAVVVDYKTGKHDAKYTRQVSSYKKLLLEMGFEQVRGYLLYIDDMEVVEV